MLYGWYQKIMFSQNFTEREIQKIHAQRINIIALFQQQISYCIHREYSHAMYRCRILKTLQGCFNLGCLISVFILTAQIEAQQPAGGAPLKKIIYVDLRNVSGRSDYQWIENSVGNNMHKTASAKYQYTRIEKTEWSSRAEDLGITPQDYDNQVLMRRLGFSLGADGVIFGSFEILQKGGATRLSITGKILSVIDNSIVSEKTVESGLDSTVFDATDELSESLASKIRDLFFPTDTGALWRTALLPGWGHFYKQRPVWGYITSGVFGAAFAYSSYSVVSYFIAKSEYDNYVPENVKTPQGETALVNEAEASAKFAQLLSDQNTKSDSALTSLYILGGIYAISLIHAWFIDAEVYATSTTESPQGTKSGVIGAVYPTYDPMMREAGVGFQLRYSF